MEVYAAVRTVLAVRDFQDKPVPDSIIRQISGCRTSHGE